MGKIIPLSKWAVMVVVIGFMSACVSIPKPQPDLTNPILTVAILPFANQSNNVDAPRQIRELLSKKLVSKFYKVLPLDEVDQILVDELGITLGEQLPEVEFSEIKSRIEADGYIYGDIRHFDESIGGAVNTNRVSAKLKMIQGSTEKVFWKNNIGIRSEVKSENLLGSLSSLGDAVSDGQDEEIRWITIESSSSGDSSIIGNLIGGLVKKSLDSAFGQTLEKESLALINNSTRNLRNGPAFTISQDD